MDELQLYEFIKNEELEIDWREKELVLWVNFYAIRAFTEMINEYLCDGGIDVNLQYECIAVDLVPICEYFGINPEAILQKERGNND